MTTELPGRTSAYLVAQVRARVDGIVQKRQFEEGSTVTADQRLFEIDPAPYQAALESAEAALARARANLESTRAQAERDKVLVAANAISQQKYVNDLAAQSQAAADVQAGIAAVKVAKINLGYTNVMAPITGRIGPALVTQGAYVQSSAATLLASVQQIDPIYVDLSQTSVEGLQLRQQVANGRIKLNGPERTKVRLQLEDGTTYSRPGTLEFTDISVNPGTGSVSVRAIFPNPDQVLLPGMFVRAVIDQGTDDRAMLIPQEGITHDRTGRATALVVDANNKVTQRPVEASRTFGSNWVVESGLEEGDRVVISGSQRVQPGMLVRMAGMDPTSDRVRSGSRVTISKRNRAMARFFIDRPIFAIVIAILIMLAGALSITRLPIEQYPTVAPPSIQITTTYPGASAATVENTVVQVIEQQMSGLDHLLYLSSTSDDYGQSTTTLTFEAGTDPDIAQVQVQNKLQLAVPQLPTQVQQSGIRVTKSSTSFLLVAAFVSSDPHMTKFDIADYVASHIQDPVSRIDGVGNINVFGTQYAMRIWLDPNKLNSFSLTPLDVTSAIQAQNVQISGGQLGGTPAPTSQRLTAAITEATLLRTPDEFGRILLKVNPDGSQVRLRDVARVELGAENFNVDNKYNGQPAAAIGFQLATGANALKTAEAIRARITELSRYFPAGLSVVYPYDTAPFVKVSIEEVVKTLFEGVVLVFLVMYLFLQNMRATLVPTIAVPVVLLGAFGVMAAAGFTINTLTMFGLVLAIGLLVDDAIVVVENVERLMEEENLSPREATRKAMGQITGALVGVAMVLSAVFVPVAFSTGSVGAIYRQFSLTIVAAMALSVFVALSLTPALCATLLRGGKKPPARGFFGWFNRQFETGRDRYVGGVRSILSRAGRAFIVYGAVIAVVALMFVKLPTSFLPDEDQGFVLVQVQGPTGGTQGRTAKALDDVSDYLLHQESKIVDAVFQINGYNFAGRGQNQGMLFVHFRDWSERKSKEPERAGAHEAAVDALRVVSRSAGHSRQSTTDPRAGDGCRLRHGARGSRAVSVTRRSCKRGISSSPRPAAIPR